MSSKTPSNRRLPIQEYIDGVLAQNRTILARAITVVESDLPSDAELSSGIVEGLAPYSGAARRVGITGVPGAGKSTFIDLLGTHLIRERQERVAVLTIDPSSPISGGSILGDKTRMEQLSSEENAFIRPSPSSGHWGGVGRHTRETILLCEAAGFQNVVVETLGVGQSEMAVRSMTDFFLLIMLPGAGDELQGIKRGILELVDAIAVNKADGQNESAAELTRAQYQNAMHLFPKSADGWSPPVLTTSCMTGKGVSEIWSLVLQHSDQMAASGFLAKRRSEQAVEWMHELIMFGFRDLMRARADSNLSLNELEKDVAAGRVTPSLAARKLLSTFK